MMNRRWFFTATGSAFLTAACAVVQQPMGTAAAADDEPMPANPEAHFRRLLDRYFDGLMAQLDREGLFRSALTTEQLPRRRDFIEERLRGELIDIYRSRFYYRLAKDEGKKIDFTLRKDQACVLGQLTALAFKFEVESEHSFDKPDEAPRLDVKHLNWARDSYGFYTNSELKERKHKIDLCGEPGGPEDPKWPRPPRRQINDPCPFCAL